MTAIAPIPRATRRPTPLARMMTGSAPRPEANANRPPVPVETRAPRRLDDAGLAELPRYANLRTGEMAEPPRVSIHPMTLLAAALIGAGMLVIGFWVVNAVWTALMAIRFPEIGVY